MFPVLTPYQSGLPSYHTVGTSLKSSSHLGHPSNISNMTNYLDNFDWYTLNTMNINDATELTGSMCVFPLIIKIVQPCFLSRPRQVYLPWCRPQTMATNVIIYVYAVNNYLMAQFEINISSSSQWGILQIQLTVGHPSTPAHSGASVKSSSQLGHPSNPAHSGASVKSSSQLGHHSNPAKSWDVRQIQPQTIFCTQTKTSLDTIYNSPNILSGNSRFSFLAIADFPVHILKWIVSTWKSALSQRQVTHRQGTNTNYM